MRSGSVWHLVVCALLCDALHALDLYMLKFGKLFSHVLAADFIRSKFETAGLQLLYENGLQPFNLVASAELGKGNRLIANETEFKANMMAGGEKVANLTKQDIKRHFEKHYTSPLADVVKDIRTLQMIQHDLRYHGIRTRHSVSGLTSMDPQKIKLFLSCSKMKMDLYSKLKSLRKDLPKNKKAAPQKFFAQEW